jgi:hypothetical protein
MNEVSVLKLITACGVDVVSKYRETRSGNKIVVRLSAIKIAYFFDEMY